MRTAVLLVALLALSSHAFAAQQPLFQGGAAQVVSSAFDRLKELWEEHKSAQENKNVRSLLTWTPGQNVGSFQQFAGNMFGGNWTQYFPESWSLPSFDWSKLGTFDYSSNVMDFVDAVNAQNITKPQSLAELKTTMDHVSSFFCTPETYVPSQKVFATCVGPKVVLQYVPKVCILEEHSQEIVCDPAKIVLSKVPGGCTHKYSTPSTWKGKVDEEGSNADEAQFRSVSADGLARWEQKERFVIDPFGQGARNVGASTTVVEVVEPEVA